MRAARVFFRLGRKMKGDKDFVMLKRHFARPSVKAINRDETNTARGVNLQFRVIN